MKATAQMMFVALSLQGLLAAAEKPTTNAPATARSSSQALISPEVHPDRKVTFRLRAPDAQGVKVSGEWRGGPTELTNNNGVWSATVGPLEAEIYGYSFTVDNGLTIADPANAWVKPMRATRTSALHIPGNPPQPWDFQSVPHGTLHTHYYFSKPAEMKRRVHVYTPPGYENGSEKYPVLYLFHGAGDNDATWSSFGHAHFIADSLLTERKMKPMIIVMTDGHPTTANPTRITPEIMERQLEVFRDDLLTHVLPLIQSTYRVRTNRADRAIIGLSMGGWQSLTIGLKHRDLFAWVGGMSSFLSDPKKLVTEAFPDSKGDLKLLWFACGKEDRLINNSRQLSAALKEKQIPHTFNETAGDHSYPVWRRYLVEFLPLAFAD
jgi:enterochelin esterase-like enzyme